MKILIVKILVIGALIAITQNTGALTGNRIFTLITDQNQELKYKKSGNLSNDANLQLFVITMGISSAGMNCTLRTHYVEIKISGKNKLGDIAFKKLVKGDFYQLASLHLSYKNSTASTALNFSTGKFSCRFKIGLSS
jgi:hypothetical protein